MYVYIYIYVYPSQSTIVALIDCAIGKMVWPIRQSFLAQRKQVLIEDFAAQTTYVERTLFHSQRFFSVRCPQTWQFISIICTISTTTPCQRGSLHFNVVTRTNFVYVCILYSLSWRVSDMHVLWSTLSCWLTFLKGEMKLVMQTIPPSANSLATSLILLMFSSLSSGEKLRFLFNPVLTLSPSSTYAGIPREQRYSSRAKEMVVFPAPDKPVWR